MPIIHEFEKHNFTEKNNLPVIINKKRYGNGLADIIPTLTNIITNKELISNISNVAKAAGSVADGSAKIIQAVKSAKELNNLKQIRRQNNTEKKKPKQKDESEIKQILNEHIATSELDPKGDGVTQSKGSGFHKF